MAFFFSPPEKQAEKAYQRGKSALYEKHDYKQAEQLLGKAAQLGHPEGQRLYATLLFIHKKDTAGALEWMEKAAAQDDPHAVRRCVELYSGEDSGMDPALVNGEKALFWAQKARQLGLKDEEELCRLAEGHQNPASLYEMAQQQFREFRYETAMRNMERAAQQGFVPAMLMCGQILLEGRKACEQSDYASILPEPKKAVGWYEKAAQLGDPEAGFRLGQLCEHSPNGDEDMPAAMEWYIKAMQQGHTGALNRFFQLYSQHLYEPFEKRLAAEWLQAAKAGDSQAGFLCAELRCRTELRPAEDKTLLAWCKAAAQQGRPEAQFRLGAMLEQGLGAQADKLQALGWYEKAGQQGHLDSIFRMGLLYYQGWEGLDQDYGKAWALFEKAARQHHFQAAAYCGLMLLRGQGTEINWGQALGWYRQAVLDMGAEEKDLPGKGSSVTFQLLQFSQFMLLLGQPELAFPLLKELARNGEYSTAFLLLAALYRQGLPGMVQPEPALARHYFSRWLDSVEPGDTLGLGGYPQHLEPHVYRQGHYFDLIPWAVLEKRQNKALLLCRLGLEYTSKDQLSHPLFSQLEQGLVLQGPFALNRQQFQTYLVEQKLDSADTTASSYARMVKARQVGISYEKVGDSIRFHAKETVHDDLSQLEWTNKENWVHQLARQTVPMLLADGAAFGSNLMEQWSTGKLVFRPAIWVGLPEE